MKSRPHWTLEEHYYITPEGPSDLEVVMAEINERDWERLGEPIAIVITDCADIPEEAAEDIRKVLYERHITFDKTEMMEENPFNSETYYAEMEVDDAESQESWLNFEQNLR